MRQWFEFKTTCPKCCKEFKYKRTEQIPGFRFTEELTCPYCLFVLKTSMEYDFESEKLEDETN